MTQSPDPQNPYQPQYQPQGEPQQPYGAAQPSAPAEWSPQTGGQQGGYPSGQQAGYGAGAQPGGWGQQGGYGAGAQPGDGWGQQGGYSSAQPGGGWGQQPGYPAGQPGYPPVQQGYPQAPGAMPYGQQPQQRSPLLGMIALGGVVVCGVVLCWLMWRMGALVGPLAASSGGTMTQDQMTQELLDQLGSGGLLALNVAGYGGTAAWITGIVAAATRRGRSYGVWAIILGVLAPIIAIVMMVAAMMPYIG